jgi:hypothetical protein
MFGGTAANTSSSVSLSVPLGRWQLTDTSTQSKQLKHMQQDMVALTKLLNKCLGCQNCLAITTRWLEWCVCSASHNLIIFIILRWVINNKRTHRKHYSRQPEASYLVTEVTAPQASSKQVQELDAESVLTHHVDRRCYAFINMCTKIECHSWNIQTLIYSEIPIL